MNTTDKKQLPATCEFCIFSVKSTIRPEDIFCHNPDSPKQNQRLWQGDTCNNFTWIERRKEQR